MFKRPLTPMPQPELDLLAKVALGDIGQSRSCRYLLALLVGKPDPLVLSVKVSRKCEPSTETWLTLTSIENDNTRKVYRSDISAFMRFVGIERPEEFRSVTRAHVIAWRKELERQALAPATVRRKLSALSDLFDHHCDSNAITHNPVKGVARPKEGSNEGKTPALSDEQARRLLQASPADTLKGKRDRAILAVLLYHALRRAELCSLRVKDYAQRRGVQTLTVYGKGAKIRYIPVHVQAVRLIEEYLDAGGHREDKDGAFFRTVKHPAGQLEKPPTGTAVYQTVLHKWAANAGFAADTVRGPIRASVCYASREELPRG